MLKKVKDPLLLHESVDKVKISFSVLNRVFMDGMVFGEILDGRDHSRLHEDIVNNTLNRLVLVNQ